MAQITQQYIDDLAPIYRDLLAAFPRLVPARRVGYGLAMQSLYTALDGKYSLAEIHEACEQMQAGGAVEIRHDTFVHPTDLGESIIEKLTGETARRTTVPPFAPPEQAS